MSRSPLNTLAASWARLGRSALHAADEVTKEPRRAVEGELAQAKAIGQFTVLTVAAKAKKWIEEELAPQPDAPVTAPTAPAESSKGPVPAVPSAIAGYQNLSAAQIVPLLAGLSEDERTQVRQYEEATRGRKTILAALS